MAPRVSSEIRIDGSQGIRTLEEIAGAADRADRALLRLGVTSRMVGDTNTQRNWDNADRSLQRLDKDAQSSAGSFGLLHSKMVLITGAAFALAPAVNGLIGLVGQLTGSLVRATGGLGVIGGGALGAFAVGLGSVGFVVKDMMSDLQKSQQLFTTYNNAVATYGANSRQAALAASRLNQELKLAPDNTLRLLVTVKALGKEWDNLTAKAQNAITSMLAQGAGQLRAALPAIAGTIVNPNAQAFARAGSGLISSFLSPESMRIFQQLSAGFRRDIGPVLQGISNLMQAFGHLAVIAQPFVTSMIRGFDAWAQRFHTSSQDVLYWRTQFTDLVGQFRVWMGMFGAVLRFIGTFSEYARGGGNEVRGITNAFNSWSRWMDQNAVKVARFFQQGTQMAHDLGHALKFIFDLFAQATSASSPTWQSIRGLIGTVITPLLHLLVQLLRTFALLSSALGGLGGPLVIFIKFLNVLLGIVNALISHVPLLGSLLAGALVVTGIVQMSSAMSGFASRISAAVGEMTALAGATERTAIASAALGGGAAVAGAAGAAPAFLGGARLGSFGAGPYAAAADYRATVGAATAMETPALGLGLSGGAELGLGARLGRSLGGLRGAGGRALGTLTSLPVMAALLAGPIAGSLGAPAQVTKGLTDIGTGAGLGATIGSVIPGVGTLVGAGVGAGLGGLYDILSQPDPNSTSAVQQRHLTGFNQRVITGYTPTRYGHTPIYSGATIHHAGLQQQIARLGGSDPHTAAQISGQIAAYRQALRGGFIPAGQRSAVQSQLQALQSVLPQVRAEQHHRQFVAADTLGQSLGRGAEMISNAQGPAAAMQFVEKQALAHWAQLGPEGRKVLADGIITWAQEMRRQNPALTKEFEDLKNSVIGKFVEVDGKIHEVHGRILTGTVQEWNQIAKAMSDPIEVAREQISKNLTLIQQQAVGSLVAMGYSSAQALSLVRALGGGGATGSLAASAIGAGSSFIASAPGAGFTGIPAAGINRRASGGRIMGAGLQDSVMLGSSTLAAPGELVVNRHTESRVNGVLGMHGLSLGGMVSGEGRPHSSPMRGYAAGGRLSLGGLMAGDTTMPGVPGAMVDTTGLEVSAAVATRLNAILGGHAGTRSLAGVPLPSGTGGSGSANQALAYQMMLSMWGGDQWPALKALWTRESGFNQFATNPTSGAYGIPQSLPASKMASAGADWMTNPATQISWGLNYIAGRYGSPSGAWNHELSANWYGQGGDFVARRPRLIGVGDRPERVTITPLDSQAGSGGRGIVVNIGTIHHNQPGDIRRTVREEIRDAIADVANEVSRVGLAPEEQLTR